MGKLLRMLLREERSYSAKRARRCLTVRSNPILPSMRLPSKSCRIDDDGRVHLAGVDTSIHADMALRPLSNFAHGIGIIRSTAPSLPDPGSTRHLAVSSRLLDLESFTKPSAGSRTIA